MKALRTTLAVICPLLLLAGYAASVRASFLNQTAEYAAKVDEAPIRALALVLLVGAVIAALLPSKGGQEA